MYTRAPKSLWDFTEENTSSGIRYVSWKKRKDLPAAAAGGERLRGGLFDYVWPGGNPVFIRGGVRVELRHIVPAMQQ